MYHAAGIAPEIARSLRLLKLPEVLVFGTDETAALGRLQIYIYDPPWILLVSRISATLTNVINVFMSLPISPLQIAHGLEELVNFLNQTRIVSYVFGMPPC